MECTGQLDDIAKCNGTDDRSTHCIVQKEMLQDYTWMAHFIISYAVIFVLLFVY